MPLLKDYQTAAAACGRPLLSLLGEALVLRLSRTRLGLSEYLDFQLYKTDLDWAAKATFAGQRTQGYVEELLIDDYSRFVSLDKVTMYAVLAGHQLPVPAVRATYRSQRPASVEQLRTPESLATYLSKPAHLPVYIKRAFGAYGRGNVVVDACDGKTVTLGNGATEPLSDFCNSLDDGKTLGWVLQDSLTSHPSIAALTGSPKISGLRVHTFLTRNSSRVTKAIFKINLGLKDSDNFEHGASGNMLAAVDIASGRVTRAVAGVGVAQKENPLHPATGKSFVDFEIPDWAQVVELVTDAQKAFPGFICPGWDIALCADGPKILEVNAFGDMDLSQHAYRQSFLDAPFMALLKERGLDQLVFAAQQKNRQSPTNHRYGQRKHHWLW